MSYPKPSVSPAKKKNLVIAAWVISIVVLLVVGGMRQIKLDISTDFSWLPGFYSGLNAIVAVGLIYGLILVKRHHYEAHKRVMFGAMLLSLLFLVCYVLYHITTPETKYCGEGGIRTVYFILLISHIVLAAIIFPFILFVFIRAVVGEYDRHKKLAKIVYPFWLYVAATGPILYLMLRPCYG